MWMNILNVLLFLTYSLSLNSFEQSYEIEFLEESIFKPCENYPDKYIHRLFDLSNMHVEQTPDGSLLSKGYILAKTSIKPSLQWMSETFKKERGTWQPTLWTQKRPDFCTSLFDENESWHPYLNNTPKEQLKCPIFEGQRFDLDINKPTIFSLPTRNAEGEYNIHLEAGHKNNVLLCVDIFVMIHKV